MSSCPDADRAAGLGLLAGIAHDLRTPLARLRLRAELECPEAVSRAMEEDFQAVTHLIDQILGYAQQCAQPSAAGQGSLHEVLTRGVAAYRQTGADVGLDQRHAHDAMVPRLPVQRMLANLVDNALTHGLGPVQVELRSVQGGLELVVFDHGPGLTADQFACAVQPFVRLGDVAAGKPGGLGLAIVAQLAQQMGGALVLRTFDGRRSGLGFHLPARG